MSLYVWLLLAMMPTVTLQSSIREKRGVFPPGDIPQGCCRVLCPPHDICTCCFVDYEYFDGQKLVKSQGVPDFLKEVGKRESADFDAYADMDQ